MVHLNSIPWYYYVCFPLYRTLHNTDCQSSVKQGNNFLDTNKIKYKKKKN